MGQAGGSLRSHRVIRERGEVSLEAHPPPSLLEFDTKESYMVSYGIDRQTSPNFEKKTLSFIAGTDAETLGSTFHKTIALPTHNIKCYVGSKAEEQCTFDGMHKTFMESASKVGTNGIFVFCFTGHGMKVGRNEWGLAPVDFNYTKEKFITAATLISWLHYVRFQGRYALFVLDCCYAGGIAEQLAKETVNADIPIPGLFVFTSCTANESSLVVTSLGHSIFNYFLTSCLFNSYSQPGQLSIKAVYEDCDACCMAFSSLLVSYEARIGLLKWSMMQPEFKFFELPRYLQSLFQDEQEDTDGGIEETDAGPPGRFQFAIDYYKFPKRGSKQRSPFLVDKSLAWLEIASQPRGALYELHDRHLLVGRLLSSAIASMMYSMASIFIACKQDNITDINVFIVSFIHVIAAVDRVHQDIDLTRHDLKLALEYYCDPLRRHKIKHNELKGLYNRIVNDIATEQLQAVSSPENEGEEFTDSGETPEKSSIKATPSGHAASNEDGIDIPELTEWIPAVWDH